MPSPTDHWARSGAAWLTGPPGGDALRPPGDPAGRVAHQLAELRVLTGAAPPGAAPPGVERPGVELPDERLLGERAACAGLTRAGSTSAGGSCRVLPAADGTLALSLARAADLDLVPALVGGPVTDHWAAVRHWLADTPVAAARDAARLLGLPAAIVPPAVLPPRRPAVVVTDGGSASPARARPLVVDLSSLWAGPLCAHLLGLAGADVVKVESTARPDGARGGSRAFFDLLHAGHRSVALDFTTDRGRQLLGRLVAAADVVVEASRPRALRRLGVRAEEHVARGAVWVSITAYGRAPEREMLVGFGDDVAAGAGLVARTPRGPVFAGDALADPLTGVQAALAATQALRAGRGCLLDVSMHDTARAAAALPSPLAPGPIPAAAVARPTARPTTGRARPLGADTAAVLAELGV